MFLKRLSLLLILIHCVLFSACSKSDNNYHEMVNIEELIREPKLFVGKRMEFVGYAYFHEDTPSLAVYPDKESAKEPFSKSLVYLSTGNLDENKKLKSCSGKIVMAFGVFKPKPGIGLLLHVDKGVKIISDKGEVKGFCYKK